MMKFPKILMIISHVIAFAVGGFLFYHYGVMSPMAQLIADNSQESKEIMALAHSQSLLFVTETQGTDAALKEEIERQIAMYDQFLSKSGKLINERTIALEKAILLLNLADLEGKVGNLSNEVRYLKQAAELCPIAGLMNCTADTIAALRTSLRERREKARFHLTKNAQPGVQEGLPKSAAAP